MSGDKCPALTVNNTMRAHTIKKLIMQRYSLHAFGLITCNFNSYRVLSIAVRSAARFITFYTLVDHQRGYRCNCVQAVLIGCDIPANDKLALHPETCLRGKRRHSHQNKDKCENSRQLIRQLKPLAFVLCGGGA
jgi:hypothetical protein